MEETEVICQTGETRQTRESGIAGQRYESCKIAEMTTDIEETGTVEKTRGRCRHVRAIFLELALPTFDLLAPKTLLFAQCSPVL